MAENVVLIVADTLRSKEIFDNDFQEQLDFFENGEAVQNYVSNSPWTMPAHATLFTGSLPSEHGVTTKNCFFDEENGLAKTFGDRGYETRAISENPLICSETGFDRNFDSLYLSRVYFRGADVWNEVWNKDHRFQNRKEKYQYFLRKVIKERDLKSIESGLKYFLGYGKSEDYNPVGTVRTLKNGIDFLQEEGKKFLFVNLMATHAPYTFDTPEKREFLENVDDELIGQNSDIDTLEDFLQFKTDSKFFEARKKMYKASIKYLDRNLDEFYSEMPDNSVLIVVGDHGELIGEYKMADHRLINHHFGTFMELIKVPLVVKTKGVELDLTINEGVCDHIALHEFVKNISDDDNAILHSKAYSFAEYFGKSGYNEQFNTQIPEDLTKIYRRKSFSLITENYKYDLTSDGSYLWDNVRDSEEEEVSGKDSIGHLMDKMDIMYAWRIEE